ncbi:MAG: tRNA uridine-5-carboxymethylaminomethyl(34) synthesis GTPase MnmE [Clostridia bacterium]|nr:tRNA uridine-5-carboxymethylaminomethyl(34) synthesis GTPase MnmE [Clostridia bacterium]
MKDIIAAIATPRGKGGVAIVRISGEGSLELAKGLFSPWEEPKPRYMYYGSLLCDGKGIDKGLAVYFEQGRSFTGEQTVELHCHGGERVSALVLEAAIKAGARPAEAGEFTKRAFLNGMIDLSGAEAVGDMIDAQSRAAVLLAGQSLSGGLGDMIRSFQSDITDILASIEASIDYPDEVSEQYTRASIINTLKQMELRLSELIDSYQYGRVRKEGITVCIMGRPNAGKSSLLNRLCGRESAIVTDIEGTTRDLLHETVEINGVAVHLYDTAGLRQSGDMIEQMGIERARKQAQSADIVLYLIDGSNPPSVEDERELGWLRDSGINHCVVTNKSDIGNMGAQGEISISALTGDGIDDIRALILKCAGEATEGITIASLRHIHALERARASLRDALCAAEVMPLDCVSIDLHNGWEALGEITGQTVNEDIIDRIFAKFCVGK